MTVRELKTLLDQVPPERLDDPVMSIMGEENEPDETQQAVQQVQGALEDQDVFANKWKVFGNTINDIHDVVQDYEDAIYLIRG